jgi:hypothetical protein
MPQKPDYEHRVIVRGTDGTILTSTTPTDQPKAAGDHFRAVRRETQGNPTVGSTELQTRPVNPNEWQSVEISRNTPEGSQS